MSRLSLLRAGTAAIALCASLPAVAQSTSNPLNLPTQGNAVPGAYPFGVVQSQFAATTAGTIVDTRNGIENGTLTTLATGNQIVLSVPRGQALNTPGFNSADPATPVNPGPFATSQTVGGPSSATTTLSGSADVFDVRGIATGNLFQVTGEPGSSVDIGRIEQLADSELTANSRIPVSITSTDRSTFVAATQGNIVSFDGVKVNMPTDGQTITQTNGPFGQAATQRLSNVLSDGPVTVTTSAIGNGVFATGPADNPTDVLIDGIVQNNGSLMGARTTFGSFNALGGGDIRTSAVGNTVVVETTAANARAIVDNLEQSTFTLGQSAETIVEGLVLRGDTPLNVITSATGNSFSLTGSIVAGDSRNVQTNRSQQDATARLTIEADVNQSGPVVVGTYASGNVVNLTGDLVRGNSVSGNAYRFEQVSTQKQDASLNATLTDVPSATFDTRAIGNQLSIQATRLQDINRVTQTSNAQQTAASNVTSTAAALSVQTIATGNSFGFSPGRP